MSATEIWIVIIGMTIVTAVTRALFLIGGERTVLPERAQRAALRAGRRARRRRAARRARNAGRAVVRAVQPSVLRGARRPRLVLWRRSMLGTIVVGMLVFTALRVIF